MSYESKSEVLPIGFSTVNIDGSTSIDWIPKRTYICYGGKGILYEAAGSSLAQTKQAAIKVGTTDLFSVTVTSSAAIGKEFDLTTESTGTCPYKFKGGTTYTIYTKNAETSKTGEVLFKLFCDIVDP